MDVLFCSSALDKQVYLQVTFLHYSFFWVIVKWKHSNLGICICVKRICAQLIKNQGYLKRERKTH